MKLTRSPFPSPSIVEVLTSMPLSGKKASPFDVVGFRGSEPTTNIKKLPRGKFFLLGKGFMFLSSEEAYYGSARKDALVGEVGNVIGQVANAAIPFGGILAALGWGTMDVALSKRSPISEEFFQKLTNPGTFIVPFFDMVECEYVKVGNILTRRNYVAVKTVDNQGESGEYCMCFVGNDEFNAGFMHNHIWLWRVLEERASAIAEVMKELGAEDEMKSAQARLLEEYEKVGKEPSHEEVLHVRKEAYSHFVRSKGITDKQVLPIAWSKLGHLLPLLAMENSINELRELAKECARYRPGN